MTGAVLACLDSVTRAHPETIGFEKGAFDRPAWLQTACDAEEGRALARERRFERVWVLGSDTVEAINMAASIRRDGFEGRLCLIAAQKNGSLASRATAAQVTQLLDLREFAVEFAAVARERDAPGRAVSLEASAHVAPGEPEALRAPGRLAGEEPAGPRAASDALSQGERGRRGAGEWLVSGGIPEGEVPFVADDPFEEEGPTGPIVARKGPAGRAPAPGEAEGLATVSGVAAGRASVPGGSAARALAEPTLECRHDAFASPLAAPDGFVVSVIGAGGGVGKSTVAALLACAAQRAGVRSVLVDADLQLGDQVHLMGAKSPQRLDEIIRSPERIGALGPTSAGPALVAAPARIESSEEVAASITLAIDALARGFELIVVDTPLQWDDMQLALIERSAAVLFVMDQRPSSVRICRQLIALCSRCGLSSQGFRFALNRCARGALLTSIDVSCSLSGARVFELADGGRKVEEALCIGRPMDVFEGKSQLGSDATALIASLLPQGLPNAEPARPKGLLSLPWRRGKAKGEPRSGEKAGARAAP